MSGIILPFKNLLLRVGGFMVLLLSAYTTMAQTASENVGIGTTKPDVSAILDLTSNSKGFLVPRMTLAQRGNIKSPANGLMVYQTDFFAGFYFFDGTNWKGLYARSVDGAVVLPETGAITPSTANTAVNAWNTTGNAGLNSDINFIGTSDTTSLTFKVNNYRSGFIDHRFGNTYLGYRAGARSHGFNSIAIGAYALYDSNLGLNNIAIGYQSLPVSKTGSDNIALGSNALYNNETGSENIAIGTQAGLRSVGDGNIFLGHKAGLNEAGNNKLYIDNNRLAFPLIYGDFETARVGINTKQPESALSIDSKLANVSGLEFKQLTSNSPAGRPTQKVLSVDEKGRVVLVRDSVGLGSGIPTAVAPSYWALKGNSIENSNAGDVIASNIRFKNLRPTTPAVKSNAKVLTVDENGLIILAKDSIAAPAPMYWGMNGNNLTNFNNGKLVINGPVQLFDITASNKTFRSYGKVLSVDDSGNLILVRDSVGTSTSTVPVSTPLSWNINGNNIANANSGSVFINNNLILSKLSSENPTTISAQKFLTVDNVGNVILANSPVATAGTGTSTASQWTPAGENIGNANIGGVYINNGLWAKKGIRLESGILDLNSATENKSGLRFEQLKASNPAGKSYGKVLSVDDDGNVILVKDSVGTSATVVPVSPPQTWVFNESNISNNNKGKVTINSVLQLGKIKLSDAAGKAQGKVLSVDEDGNIVLVKDSVGVATTPIPVSTSPWTIAGNNIINSNVGKVNINNGLQFGHIKASNPAGKAYGKVLSVDDEGNLILVKDSVGTSITTIPVSTPSSWTVAGNNIANNNAGKVSINNGLILPQITSETATAVNSQKFLTVDNAGNVILANAVSSEVPTVTTPWTISGNNISNSNNGRVSIGNGLSTKNGLIVESGKLEANGAVVLSQLKSSSAAGKSYGKVLSVDENGQIILVKDSVGTSTTITPPASTPSPWNISGNNIGNNNTGSVSISNGLTLTKLSSNNTPTVTTQKVLSVDADGNVILVNTPSAGTPVVAAELWKANLTGGIFNTSLNGISVVGSEEGKSGLQFSRLKAASTAGNSYGKVLSVDDNGNVILVNDAVGGGATTTTAAGWNIVDGRVQNTNNGKVVIGTGINSFPDGFQLFVKGGILTERVRVAVANSDRWADYVLKQDYRLMPLKDVEKFINHHEHLPNVPSAEEMAKNGLDVMEISAKLMEKIEELTLYMIDANKKIEALEAKVKVLDKGQK